MALRPRSSESGNITVSMVSEIVAWPSHAWITFGFRDLRGLPGGPRRPRTTSWHAAPNRQQSLVPQQAERFRDSAAFVRGNPRRS
jgi:hypothetical protein